MIGFALTFLALLFLVAAWVSTLLTIKAVYTAIGLYGFSVTNILLDANFGYLGLLSLGLSSCALVLANTNAAKDRLRLKIHFFRSAFFIGLLFLTPAIFAIVYYLVR